MKARLGACILGGLAVALIALFCQGCGSLILPAIATPIFSPAGGTYSVSQSVVITDATPGASIYFTTDGTTPSIRSTAYTGAITVAANATIRAIAGASGPGKSAVATATYVISMPVTAAPTISPVSGTYALPQNVTITDTTPNASIYYTTNGTTPTTSATLYTGPIAVTSAATVQAIAVAPGYLASAVTSASYVIAVQAAAATPVILPAGGTYATTQNVTISDATPGASIYYTTDGTMPTTASKLYVGAIAVSSTETIMAIAVAPGYSNSAVASATFTITPVTAGAGTWTWMAGSNTANAGSIYGVQGVASPLNTPGARSDSSSWTGSDGKFWLFGGQIYDVLFGSMSGFRHHNDLWQYDPAAGMWTWVNGSTVENSAGSFGTQGVPASSNVPSARIGASTWTDKQGKLWLLGGSGWDSAGNAGLLNDMWMFDVQSRQWTWVAGSASRYAAAAYGTQGVASASNTPGARAGGMTWVDSQGNLWLFGGQSAYFAVVSELWMFNTATRQWTWIAGPQTADNVSNYGVKGAYSTTTIPGARHNSATWKDSSGNFWLFGGEGYASSGSDSLLNDLWELEPTTANWRWMGGSQTFGAIGSYGTEGIPSPNNIPGAREWTAYWTDTKGQFWLLGGFTTSPGSISNDLWMFDPASGQWTWVSGSNSGRVSGVYGTLGTPSSTNVPGARLSPGQWVDSSGQLWMFGGYGMDGSGTIGDLNDLWRYHP